MSTALVPMADLQRYAEAFSKSGMFGTKTIDQAMSLLLLAQAEGVHPAIAMRDFDIIQGRPAKKAQAMHRSFLEAGGKIEWHERSDTKADATFSHPAGGSVRVTWDMERAKKAGLSGKDMYGKYGRQMLSARVISEGCRTVYPAATSGLYVPEEVRNFEKKPGEKDMGPAQVVHEQDVDLTQEIPGVGASAPAATGSPSAEPPSSLPPAADGSFISQDQVFELGKQLSDCDPEAEGAFLRIAKLERIDRLPSSDYVEALDWIKRRKAKPPKKAAA
jgi:hypothetical protein